MQHTGTDGTEVWDRVMRYGNRGRWTGENLSYGEYYSGADVIMALYIDDGVPNRGHRKALMRPQYKYTGIAECDHNSDMKKMYAFAYSSNFNLNQTGHEKIS